MKFPFGRLLYDRYVPKDVMILVDAVQRELESREQILNHCP